jgi:hypothetical protein
MKARRKAVFTPRGLRSILAFSGLGVENARS